MIEDLGLNMNHHQLRGSITITNPEGTHIMEVTARSSDPETAKKIADTMAVVSAQYIKEKMEAAENIFRLEERWSSLLEVYFSSMVAGYEAVGITDIHALKAEMEHDLRKEKARVRVQPDLYIETEYLEWLCQKQLKAFYSNMKQMDKTPVIVP